MTATVPFYTVGVTDEEIPFDKNDVLRARLAKGRPLANALRIERAQERRQVLLDALKDGIRLNDAIERTGWSGRNTYRMARTTHPEWAAEVDFWRGQQKAGLIEERAEAFSFPEFVNAFFPDRRPHLPHQLQIANILEDIGPREIVLCLLWPAAGKTATIEDYICRKLANDPSHRFRYVSESSDLSKRIIGTCKRRFTDEGEYGKFIKRFGPFYEKGQERQGKPWTTDQIMLANNPGKERDRNLVATSWTGANYGSRVDTLILDDLQSQNNMNSSEDMLNVVRGTFFNRDSRGSPLRTLIIGTRIGQGDFYERLRNAGLVTREIIMPVQDEHGDPRVPEAWDQEMFHNGKACCMGFREDTCPRDNSQLTPREYMELLRHQQGERVWASSYLQNPTHEGLSTFSQYLEKCFDMDRGYGPLVPA